MRKILKSVFPPPPKNLHNLNDFILLENNRHSTMKFQTPKFILSRTTTVDGAIVCVMGVFLAASVNDERFCAFSFEIEYRGQTYDNAINMSRQYSGLQTRIKEINPLADYIPCSAHSLNLVVSTLKEIKNNDKQKAQTRCEAKDVLKSLACFENNFMSIFWGDLLERFNAVSKKLQSIDIDLYLVVQLYESLIQYISNLRNKKMFKMYEDRASKLHGGNTEYKLDVQRKRKRKIFYDESQDELNYKIHTESFKRKVSYDKLTLKHSFLFNLTTISESEVFKCAENLCKIYKDDLDKSFCNECVHFQSRIKSLKDKAPNNIRDLSTLIRSKDLQAIYPYVDIALRMFLCTPATNCSSERSFSTLRRLKTYLRSAMNNDRLNALAVLNIESELTSSINYDNIIKEFAKSQLRKKI
ncbi:hypothetical protein QTP88_025149 [Uroleucon formosanum]